MIRIGIPRVFRLALRRRDRWERDVEDEIKLHLLLRAEQLAARGSAPDDAYREAVRRFGPLEESRALLLDAASQREHHMQRTEFFGDLRQDVSFALRTLGREKAWTAVTVATLALGIGATTAVFSVVSTLLLHPLAYPDADRIVYIHQQPSSGNNTGIAVTVAPSGSVVAAWKAQSRSFEALEGFRVSPTTLKTTSEPATIISAAMFPSLPAFAGQRPLIGRMFTTNDIRSGGHVALLGESFWRDRLGASTGVLGQTITLRDSSFVVIGVMPAAFQPPRVAARPVDVWLPLDIRDEKNGLILVGRLRRGTTVGAATKELDSIYARSTGFVGSKIPFAAVVTTPAQQVRFRDSLMLLTGAVGLVLLVALANVAHLLLARSTARQREMAIRTALGAGRGRLLRQLVTDGLIVSTAGALAGVEFGWITLRALIAFRPPSHDELLVAHLDPTTLALAVGLAVVSGVGFGVLGALRSSRTTTHDSLKSGTPSSSASREHGGARAALVVSEMALSAMLLVGATLLIRSVTNLQHASLGFEPAGLYTLNFDLSRRFDNAPARKAFLTEYMGRLARLPGIQSSAVATVGPGMRWFSIGRLEVQGESAPAKSAVSFVDVNGVQPAYFRTMRIALTQGTTFSDTSPASRQVIINDGFARKHWPAGGAVGQRIRIAQTDSEPWLTIVGVAGDAATSGPESESTAPVLYSPAHDNPTPIVIVRTTGGAASLAKARALARSMGLRSGPEVDSVEGFIGRSISGPRFVMLLMTIFTALALILACVGLYGVMAYTVSQQTREIGIRVALGASRSRVARAVLARGTTLAIVGTVAGLGAAAWGTKLIQGQLHGVARWDPMSFVVGGVVLIAAAIAACVVPTRRALAVDPMTAIRAD